MTNKLNKYELDELVAKWESGEGLTWWYALLLWYYYGSVELALIANEKNWAEKDKSLHYNKEELAEFATPQFMHHSTSYVNPSQAKKIKSFAQKEKQKERKLTTSSYVPERTKSRETVNDEDGNEGILLSTWLATETLVGQHNQSEQGIPYTVGGEGGDFAGGGSGGSWTEDAPTATATMGGSFESYS
jgi:hypothetical protein